MEQKNKSENNFLKIDKLTVKMSVEKYIVMEKECISHSGSRERKLEISDIINDGDEALINLLANARVEEMLRILIDFENDYMGVTECTDMTYAKLSRNIDNNIKNMVVEHFYAKESLENSMKEISSLSYIMAKNIFWNNILNYALKRNSVKDTQIPSIL